MTRLARQDTAAMQEPHDLLQAARALLPSAIGVLFGLLARWSRDAKAGKVKSWRRLVLLDLPTMGALTIIAGEISQRMDASPLTASSIGVAVAYAGLEAVNTYVTWRLRPPVTDPAQAGRG